MIISEKKLKELDLILNRDNKLKVTEAIRALRNEIPFKGAIGLLVSYYDRCSDNSIMKLIRDFLNDLKDRSAMEEVVSGLRKMIKQETRRMVISSCWQSGLDYSGYASEFTRYFIECDYMTAVECFTVIESSVNKITRSKKDELIKLIRAKSTAEAGEKSALIRELISVLS